VNINWFVIFYKFKSNKKITFIKSYKRYLESKAALKMKFFIELMFLVSLIHLSRSQETTCSALENDVDFKGNDRKNIFFSKTKFNFVKSFKFFKFLILLIIPILLKVREKH
jgi:hypothetical protein